MATMPPIIQTPRISSDVCTCCATTYGLIKMPAPTMPPITIMVASNSPTWRSRPVGVGCGIGLEADEVNEGLRIKGSTVARPHASPTIAIRSGSSSQAIQHGLPLRSVIRNFYGDPVELFGIELVQCAV